MSGYNFQKNIVFFCLKIFLTFTNSVDPGEMLHYAAFHLDLHYLQKYSFRGFQNTKRVKNDSHLYLLMYLHFGYFEMLCITQVYCIYALNLCKLSPATKELKVNSMLRNLNSLTIKVVPLPEGYT